jgi:hypothetical protein
MGYQAAAGAICTISDGRNPISGVSVWDPRQSCEHTA